MESIHSLTMGKRLKKLRESHMYSQYEVAERIGVAGSCISMYENDRRRPSRDILIKLATLYNIDMNTICGFDPATNQHTYRDTEEDDYDDNRYWQDKEFISPKNIAHILGIHLNTAYEIIHQMPYIKIGRSYRVAVKAFEKWIRDNERRSRYET